MPAARIGIKKERDRFKANFTRAIKADFSILLVKKSQSE